MAFGSLSVVDFRSYAEAQVDLAPGLTVIVGPNGHGKTNLLEALGLAAGLGSFRGAADGALIRDGAPSAVVRCSGVGEAGREALIEVELARARPNRSRVNRQPVARRRDLLGVLAATAFSPEDLELVKGEPAVRRRWIDDALAAVRPSWGALRTELDRILRQRNTLLRQAQGRATGDVVITLDVWDAKLAEVGDELRKRRRDLLAEMQPRIGRHYGHISRGQDEAGAAYRSSWADEPLADALAAARAEDLKRSASTVGPHRDDVVLEVGGRPARSHASQGEQRSLALALRLAVDGAVREHRGVAPSLLLDDVFSELDDGRAVALLETLPPGQRILTTASSELPAGVRPDLVIRVTDGTARPVPRSEL